ncbi:hypothetical protein [Lactococcus lactis]|uniref:hypothetical protein n=1 Tax=Lactococcus lactis TaxID=1358 RepID=UPI000CE508A3|nr:hypothetical protein [Lactococcus lactis]PPA66546.1 hypothetical protein C3952_10245 [Lactococcus lactis]
MYEISFNVKLSDGSFMSDIEYNDNPYKCILEILEDVQLFFSGFTNYFYPDKDKEIDFSTHADIKLEITLPDKRITALIEKNTAYIALLRIITRAYQCLVDNELE